MITITRVLTGIWFARNRKVWEEKGLEANMVMELSSKQITEWQLANLKNQMFASQNHSRRGGQVKWEPPANGWVKLNVDASVKVGDSVFTVGMVIRNEHGHFVMGRNLKVAGQVEVIEAEAYGVLEALQWINEMQLQQVIIESDSSLVIQALQQQLKYYMEVGNIMEACLQLMQGRDDLVLCHVKKHANRVAHTLARIPCLVGCYNVFISPPQCVLELLLSAHVYH